jgi:HK97 gp10 family phage protein
MSITIDLKGPDAIKRAFAELPPRLARKVIRRGLRAGAKIVRADAQAHAPVDTGLTRKAIKVRSGRGRKKGLITMGVVIGQGDYRGETFYGAFQEFGWKAGERGSEHRRQVEGKHFMGHALAEKEGPAKAAIAEVISDGIEREAEGLAR